ncbi:hypothetical protein LZ31DRAFT_273834 [Colletotrichum somersetense]|nr:hypothetical protein LZ31DRAFT_273834 [Colletotrichum somersetense]
MAWDLRPAAHRRYPPASPGRIVAPTSSLARVGGWWGVSHTRRRHVHETLVCRRSATPPHFIAPREGSCISLVPSKFRSRQIIFGCYLTTELHAGQTLEWHRAACALRCDGMSGVAPRQTDPRGDVQRGNMDLSSFRQPASPAQCFHSTLVFWERKQKRPRGRRSPYQKPGGSEVMELRGRSFSTSPPSKVNMGYVRRLDENVPCTTAPRWQYE